MLLIYTRAMIRFSNCGGLSRMVDDVVVHRLTASFSYMKLGMLSEHLNTCTEITRFLYVYKLLMICKTVKRVEERENDV